MNRLTEKGTFFEIERHYQDTRKGNVIDKLGQIEDLMEQYGINDLIELKIALDYYEHRFDDVQTRRKD